MIGTHPDILTAIETGAADRADEILGTHIAEAGELLYRSWERSRAEEAALLLAAVAVDSAEDQPLSVPVE